MLWTAPTGALAGAAATSGVDGVADAWAGAGPGGGVGASAADSDAVGVPGAGGGGGGGNVPLPNSAGEALGNDGSGMGAAAAMCCALVLSAIRASAIFSNAARSGSGGFGGTVARFG